MSDPIKKAIFGYADLGKKEDRLGVKAIEQYNRLLETADRRLRLLRQVANVLPWCPYCEMLVDGNILRHADGCKLAEELK